MLNLSAIVPPGQRHTPQSAGPLGALRTAPAADPVALDAPTPNISPFRPGNDSSVVPEMYLLAAFRLNR